MVTTRIKANILGSIFSIECGWVGVIVSIYVLIITENLTTKTITITFTVFEGKSQAPVHLAKALFH